jgi:predicted RNase H-like HicB family nuclease
MADGTNHEQVVANIGIAMQEWIETAKSLNRPIPEPKGRKLMFA